MKKLKLITLAKFLKNLKEGVGDGQIEISLVIRDGDLFLKRSDFWIKAA